MEKPRSLRSRLKEGISAPMREIYRKSRSVVLSLGLPRGMKFVQPKDEQDASGDFSVVMPIFDPPPLARCLASVERYAPKAEVILVDDGSILSETKRIIKEYATRNRWITVQNKSSLGHSGATEAGALCATRRYLCLLNADTIVTPWSWRAAQEAFEADAKIAVTGPTTSHAATVQMVRRAELCRHYWSDSQVFGFAQKYVQSQPSRCWVDLPDIAGFALFIRRDVWERSGGFDPNLRHYGNEVELCKRILKQGFRIVWTRNSYIHHLGGQSYSNSAYGVDFIVSSSQKAQDYIDRKHS
jgi:GT2 family glycosyltransferase